MTAITNAKALQGAVFSAGDERLARLLERGLGLAPTPANVSAFIDQCHHRAKSLDIDYASYLDLLNSGSASARSEWMAMAPVLTVGETFLFRDAALWRLIEKTLLPSVASLTRPLWLWSAGCSTGEEAYTLAIVARRALAIGSFSILGTDVNPKAVAAARVGAYTPWSLRGVKELHHDGFIVSGTQTVRIHEDVKTGVRFEVHNLTDPQAYPPAGMASFECIVCRNVLIYMTPAAKAAVIRSLAGCLTPGGVLVLGHGEATGVDLAGLVAERHDAAVVYRKALAGSAPIAIAAAPKAAPRRAVVKQSGGPRQTHHMPARGKAEPSSSRVARQRRGPDASTSVEQDSLRKTRAAQALAVSLVHARAGELELAERHVHAAIEADALEPAPYVLLAALLASRDRFKEAEISLRRALFLDPMFIPGLWQMATLYRLTNRDRQATYTFARLLSRLEGLPPDQEALPFDNLNVEELRTLLRAALDEPTRD